MRTKNLIDLLDKILSDNQIIQDLTRILKESNASDVGIEISEGGVILIPEQVDIVIVTKAFFKENYDIGFQTGYRVMVAIGGITHKEFGVLYAQYCFATLYYNPERNLITSDFHKEMR